MDIITRRRGGVFFTPLTFAKKACQSIETTLGKHWWRSGNYRLWDMAAGTGNLELVLPTDVLQYCYLSTLEEKDVQHLKKEFPSATVFQYDYLEDDVEPLFDSTTLTLSQRERGREFKMPDALQKDLANPKIKWIILINPPYATAQEAGLKGTSKGGVSDTKIRKQMHADGLGEVSRELYVQFLYRIMHEFAHRETLLGVFSPIKYLVSTNYQKFRDNIFQAVFQSGFIFSSENFGGTSKTSHFPVAFILWDIHSQRPLSPKRVRVRGESARRHTALTPALSQRERGFQLDILDNSTQKIGTKTLTPANRNDFLSRWIKRPPGITIFPPFGSALTIKSGNTDPRHRIAEGFLASLMCPGNELQNQQQTAFLSGPQVSAGALSVTPENFEQAVVVFAARRIPKDSWINHVDQLLRPNRKLSPHFVTDCAVWSLFDSKNQTVALRNVIYQDQIYQVVNHFFPFAVAEVREWGEKTTSPLPYGERVRVRGKNDEEACSPHPSPLPKGEGTLGNSFVVDWLSKQKLSAEAQAVLTSAKAMYRFYFANLHLLQREQFKIETYDAGWYQIRQALLGAKLGTDLLADLKYQHDRLKEKILPQLYDYGILN